LPWLAFAAVKVSSPWDKIVVQAGDGRIWATIGQNPLFSDDFWFANRPFTLPLIYKVLGDSDVLVGWFQSVLAIVSWGVFADTIARYVFRPSLSFLVFVAILGFALTTPVHAWDVVLRTESVSASFLFLFFAALLRVLGPVHVTSYRGKKYWLVLSLVSALLAAFSRDTNAYILMVAAGFVPVVLLVARLTGSSEERSPDRRRRNFFSALLLCGGLLGIAFVAQDNVKRSRRYEFPLMNVIFKRVLPSKARLAYFRDELGMPVSRALMKRQRKFASADRREAFRSPALAEFREWLGTRGYAGYQRYLLSHLRTTVWEAYDFLPRLVRHDFRRNGRRSANVYTERMDSVFLGGPLAENPHNAMLAIAVVAVGAFILGGVMFALSGSLRCSASRARSRKRTSAFTVIPWRSSATVWSSACLFGSAGSSASRWWSMPSWRSPPRS
jgi:hypothetical protein